MSTATAPPSPPDSDVWVPCDSSKPIDLVGPDASPCNLLTLPRPQANIEAAYERIKPFVHETPVHTNAAMDDWAGRQLFFKCELFQVEKRSCTHSAARR
jgi:hypothetical protein